MSKRANILLLIAALVLSTFGGAVVGYFAQNHTPAKPQFVSAPARGTLDQPPIQVTYSGAGTFLVPGTVKPGVYMVTVGGSSGLCRWQRLRAISIEESAVIEWADVTRGTYGRMAVNPHDVGVRFIGDCAWFELTLIPSAPK